MPRIARNQINTTYFHILIQGINHEYVFNQKEEIKKYLKLLEEIKKDFSLQIRAYCIMNNHVHLLIKSDKINELSKFMHRVNTRYAMYYNKRHERDGYVFRSRFKSQGIYDEEYYYACINYIHNNPVKAGICKRKEDYEFSSYKSFKKRNIILDQYNEKEDFIEDEFDNSFIQNIIKTYYKKNDLNTDKLIKSKDKLKELTQLLNVTYKLSYREIEDEIGISRETLRKIMK